MTGHLSPQSAIISLVYYFSWCNCKGNFDNIFIRTNNPYTINFKECHHDKHTNPFVSIYKSMIWNQIETESGTLLLCCGIKLLFIKCLEDTSKSRIKKCCIPFGFLYMVRTTDPDSRAHASTLEKFLFASWILRTLGLSFINYLDINYILNKYCKEPNVKNTFFFWLRLILSRFKGMFPAGKTITRRLIPDFKTNQNNPCTEYAAVRFLSEKRNDNTNNMNKTSVINKNRITEDTINTWVKLLLLIHNSPPVRNTIGACSPTIHSWSFCEGSIGCNTGQPVSCTAICWNICCKTYNWT